MKSLKYATLLIMTISMLLSGIAFNHDGGEDEHTRTIRICLSDLVKNLTIDPIPIGGGSGERCHDCPSSPTDIDWDISLSDPVFESLTLVPVNLRRPVESLSLSGLELVSTKDGLAGGLRLTKQRATISGLEFNGLGQSGAFRLVARFRKGVPAGRYSLDIAQRLSAASRMIRKDRLFFLLTDCPSGLGECEKNPITSELLQHVYARHSPIYPRAGDVVTYTASARGKVSEGIGVSEIEIEVEQMEISADLDQTIPVDITTVDTYGTFRAFPDNPMDAEVTLELGPFPENTWVKYEARATLEDGTVLSDVNIRHAANWTDKKLVNFYKGALPIYKRGYAEDKFDFLFVPDVDYGEDEDAYIGDLENMIYSEMFSDPPYRWKRFRRYMNIYMNLLEPRYMGDVETFSSDEKLVDKPDNFDGLNGADEKGNSSDLTFIDVAVVMHQTAFQDWAFLGLMEGKFCTADEGPVINMEALHALMKLRDEYEGDRSQPDIAHPNVFDSKDDCEKHVAEHPGFSPGHCEQGPGDSSFWHWCDSYQESIGVSVHVMDTNGSGPFMVEERCQMAWAVDNLLGDPAGSAYGKMWVYGCDGFPCVSTEPSGLVLAEIKKRQMAEEEAAEDSDAKESESELENNSRRGKTLILSVLLTDDGAVLRNGSVVAGPAPNLGTATVYKGKEKEAPFRIELLKGSRVVQEFAASDPRLITTEGGEKVAAPLSKVEWDIRLPLGNIRRVDRIRIVDKQQRRLLDRRLRIVN
jgi:hypothetical protein